MTFGNGAKETVVIAVMSMTGIATGIYLSVFPAIWYMESQEENDVDILIKLIMTILPFVIVVGIALIIVLILEMRQLSLYKANSIAADQNAELHGQVKFLLDKIEELQHAYLYAEKINRAKSKFVSRISHDLRTPMNAIVGYSHLMEQACDEPEKVGHYARKIILSGRTLMELINDVLDMNSIESGNVKIVKNNFSLDSALQEMIAAISPQSEARGQKFNFYMNNDTGIDLIVGDKRRLCQILRNILSNAVKYTPEGGNVDFIVNVLDTGGKELHMLSQIKDTGCGMSKEFLSRVFEPFVRENNQTNINNPGSGLGMCIAKSFVDLMNGSLTVESKPGAGTLVTIGIPLTPLVEENNCCDMMPENAELLRGLRFLAAEDNESNSEILYEVLTAMGAECVLTKDGQEAVEVFEASDQDTFDVILLDIQMPVMNGYQAAAAIRKSKHPDAGQISIVAMTADAFEEDVQKAFVCGMNAHIAKPLDLQRFINTIASLNVRTSSTDMQ